MKEQYLLLDLMELEDGNVYFYAEDGCITPHIDDAKLFSEEESQLMVADEDERCKRIKLSDAMKIHKKTICANDLEGLINER